MAFPETRLTLIRRIATGDDQAAWKQFVTDYWRPICLFARGRGNLRWEDAEDIGSQILELFSRKELLQRWLTDPRARFKTLVCGVVRHLTLNRNRSNRTQTRQLQAYAEDWESLLSEKVQPGDAAAFYGVWADELLRNTVQAVMWRYHQEGRGNYFRVLHGRVCDGLSNPQIASMLKIKVTDVENYYRHGRQRLTEQLQVAIQHEVDLYGTASENFAEEYQHEWRQLAEYLDAKGGLEEAIRRASMELDVIVAD